MRRESIASRSQPVEATVAIKFVDVDPEGGAKPKKAAVPKAEPGVDAKTADRPSDDPRSPEPDPKARGRKGR